MTQQPNLQSLPSPLAVPWTPAPQPQDAPLAQMPPAHMAAQAMPQMTAPQSAAQMTPQPPAHAPMQPDLAPQQHTYQPQPAYAPTQQRLQHSQTPPAFQMPPGQAPHMQEHPQAVPQAQTQAFQAPQVHPGLPPMPQQHSQMAQPMQEAPASLLSRLKPKPKASGETTAPARSGSLFDMKFLIAFAAGTVLGFVVLPMVFGGSNAQRITPVAEAPIVEAQPAFTPEGGSFVDAALAETP